MRLLAVLALGLALVSAGCLGGDEEPTDGTTPTPGTPTPTTGGTGTGTGNGTGTGTGTGTGGNGTGTGGSTPTPKAPVEVLNDAPDFTRVPTPPATEIVTTKAFTVPAGYAKLTLNVTWTPTGPAVAQNGVAINVLAPDASVVATCNGPAAGPGTPTPCTVEGAALPAGGEYTAQYKGSGNLKATVVVIAS